MVYFWAGLSSFVLSLLLFPLAQQLGLRFGLIDQPSKRKVHQRPTPRSGGVVFFVVFWLLVGVLTVRGYLPKDIILPLFVPGAIIFALGLLDDKFSLSPYPRLIGQILAGIILFALGIRIDTINIPFVGMFPLSLTYSFLLTLFWFVLLINIINWLDGLNGLAGGVSLIAFAFIIYTAFLPWVSV